MQRFNDLRLSIKALIAPGTVLLALIAMAVLAIVNANDQEAATRRLDKAVFEPLQHALELKDATTLFHAQLFALISSAPNETDKQKLAADAAALAPMLDRNRAMLERLTEELSADAALHEQAMAAMSTFQGYADGAKQTIEMAQVDAAYGVMMMGDTDKKFQVLRTQLDKLSKGLQDHRTEIVADMLAGMATARTTLVILVVAAALLSILAAILVGRAISKPVVRLTGIMSALAGGDLSVVVPDRDRRDELGEMAKAVQVFKESGIERERLEAQQADERATKEQRARLMDQLTRNFESKVADLVGSLSSAATEMQATAQSMSAIADQTNQQSVSVAAAAEQASVNVQTVATAAEELSSSISEIGRQVSQSTQIAGRAVEDARHTNQTVQALADGAQKIGEVVNLIQDIAEQTNLLALNATIEAARAGEAGKGFAVVASEVKSLATQTAQATEEIGQQIAETQEMTKRAVEAIRSIGETIGEISEIAASIASAVEEQGAATQEIARNVQQAAQGTGEVSSNIVGVKTAAADAGAAASQVLDAAGELSRYAENMTAEVNEFLSAVKIA